MARRMILTLGVILVLLSALGFVKFKQVQSAIAAGSSFQPPPAAVTSLIAHQEQWLGTLNMIGTAEAVHGVTVSADLAGIVDQTQVRGVVYQWRHNGNVSWKLPLLERVLKIGRAHV